ncbi:MAG: LacI family transcriptional regulator [Chloroflexota bacterium]|nr:LacI family transcriptional regulator [Chloroflexota bacterium]
MNRPRIIDVAKQAGVSKTAVSFAYNRPGSLNAATRDRILAAADQLGYRPSPIARRLARQRTDQIGLVIPQPTHDMFANPFLAELIRGIGDICDGEGIAVVVVPPVHGSISNAVDAALVDGLILLGLSSAHPDFERVGRASMPIVALAVEDWEVGGIAIDDIGGAQAAAEHLRDLGHRDVAVLLIGPHPDSPGSELTGISARRLAGVRRGFGLDPGEDHDGATQLRLVSRTVSEAEGRDAFAELAAGGLPSAVMAMSDVTAIGVMNAAADYGVRIPDDLSIVGFDDIPAASWVTPRLTTVHQPIRDLGRLAARRLVDSIRSGDAIEMNRLIPTRLIVRGSTASPSGIQPRIHRRGGEVLGDS